MEALIEERTGTRSGAGGFFRIAPHVDDLPGRFSVEHRGVRLLAMGSPQSGGGGCMCAENGLLRALLSHLLWGDDDVLIVDMHAGVEHLGRATVDSVDAMLVVVQPTRRSLATAEQIRRLASDIGLARLALVGNQVESDEDARFLEEAGPDLPLLGVLPRDPGAARAERLGLSCYDEAPRLLAAVSSLVDRLEAFGALDSSPPDEGT
jgi:CO dehydrogenase maturation factor